MPIDSQAQTLRPPQEGRKYFSVDEANRALTYVAPIVDDICATYRDAVSLKDRLTDPESNDDTEARRKQYDQTIERLNSFLDELQQAGVELKDHETGLIDFPAIRDDREVCLCWKAGEPQILAWHEYDAGFAGRQDINTFAPEPASTDN